MTNSAPEKATEFVRYILHQLCEKKDEVVVESKIDHLGTLISIRVHEDDMGKVIGKSGQTISALRLLVRGMGAKNNEKINLKVLETGDTINL